MTQRCCMLLLGVGVASSMALPLGYRPNIIFNLADDFGHYNSGWAGNPEARTPNIDALVAEGVIMDRHYTFKYCSPTRSSFLSGRLPYHVNQANRAYSAVGGVDLRMTMVSEKLKSAGYSTHQIGKWHAGSSSAANLPVNRGFDSSYGYLGGSEGHFDQREGNDGAADQPVDLWVDTAPGYGLNGTYNAFAYTRHAVNIIQNATATTPLFIYHAWQETHVPNEVPIEYESSAIDFPLRRVYEGMAHCMDSGIGNVTAALKAAGLYERTLIVFSSDNGGREDGIFGGNNYPLRGMKFSDYEGGTRVASWVSGGVIPPARRGTTHSKGLAHICDWYATFSALAGVDPTDAKAASNKGIPAIDSVNLWGAISSGSPTNRTTIVLSVANGDQWDDVEGGADTDEAMIVWPYKYISGKQKGMGVWTGKVHPNSTARLTVREVNHFLLEVALCDGIYADVRHSDDLILLTKDNDPGCPTGCLYNIEQDPTEHVDLASSEAAIFAKLQSQLAAAALTVRVASLLHADL